LGFPVGALTNIILLVGRAETPLLAKYRLWPAIHGSFFESTAANIPFFAEKATLYQAMVYKPPGGARGANVNRIVDNLFKTDPEYQIWK